MLQACAGVVAVRRFAARPPVLLGPRVPVTVLKPLHGDEPLLEAALATFFTQDYPAYQLVFGVSHVHDPAIASGDPAAAAFPGRRRGDRGCATRCTAAIARFRT